MRDDLLLLFKKDAIVKTVLQHAESLKKQGDIFQSQKILGEILYTIDSLKGHLEVIKNKFVPYRVDTLKDKPYFKDFQIMRSDTTYFKFKLLIKSFP